MRLGSGNSSERSLNYRVSRHTYVYFLFFHIFPVPPLKRSLQSTTPSPTSFFVSLVKWQRWSVRQVCSVSVIDLKEILSPRLLSFTGQQLRIFCSFEVLRRPLYVSIPFPPSLLFQDLKIKTYVSTGVPDVSMGM
jgi:hypothetical protein